MQIINPTVINTAGIQKDMQAAQAGINLTSQQISSGKEIVDPVQNPGAVAVIQAFTEYASILDGVKSSIDTVGSLLETTSGAIGVVHDQLNILLGYAEQAASPTMNDSQRDGLQVVVQQFLSNFDTMVQSVNYNGIPLLTGSGASNTINFPTTASITNTNGNVEYTGLAAPNQVANGTLKAAASGALLKFSAGGFVTNQSSIADTGTMPSPTVGATVSFVNGSVLAGTNTTTAPTSFNTTSTFTFTTAPQKETDVQIIFTNTGAVDASKSLNNLVAAMNSYTGDAAMQGLNFELNATKDGIVAKTNSATAYYGGISNNATTTPAYAVTQNVYGLQVGVSAPKIFTAQTWAGNATDAFSLDISSVINNPTGFVGGFANANPFTVSLASNDSTATNTNNVLKIQFVDNAGILYAGVLNVGDNSVDSANHQIVLNSAENGYITVGLDVVKSSNVTKAAYTPQETLAMQQSLNAQFQGITGITRTMSVTGEGVVNGITNINATSATAFSNISISEITIAPGDSSANALITVKTSDGAFTSSLTGNNITPGANIVLSNNATNEKMNILVGNVTLNLSERTDVAAFQDMITAAFSSANDQGLQVFIDAQFDTTTINLPNLQLEALGLAGISVATANDAVKAVTTVSNSIAVTENASNSITAYRVSMDSITASLSTQLTSAERALEDLSAVDVPTALRSLTEAKNAFGASVAMYRMQLTNSASVTQMVNSVAQSI